MTSSCVSSKSTGLTVEYVCTMFYRLAQDFVWFPSLTEMFYMCFVTMHRKWVLYIDQNFQGNTFNKNTWYDIQYEIMSKLEYLHKISSSCLFDDGAYPRCHVNNKYDWNNVCLRDQTWLCVYCWCQTPEGVVSPRRAITRAQPEWL